MVSRRTSSPQLKAFQQGPTAVFRQQSEPREGLYGQEQAGFMLQRSPRQSFNARTRQQSVPVLESDGGRGPTAVVSQMTSPPQQSLQLLLRRLVESPRDDRMPKAAQQSASRVYQHQSELPPQKSSPMFVGRAVESPRESDHTRRHGLARSRGAGSQPIVIPPSSQLNARGVTSPRSPVPPPPAVGSPRSPAPPALIYLPRTAGRGVR